MAKTNFQNHAGVGKVGKGGITDEMKGRELRANYEAEDQKK